MKRLSASLLLVAAFVVGSASMATAADAAVGIKAPSADSRILIDNWPN